MQHDVNLLHSSSCINYKGEIYVAFYAGERECVNQRVYIFKYKQDTKEYVLYHKLNYGTGNPVLFTLNEDLYCAYSVFTKKMKGNVFDLWQTCYTAITQINEEGYDFILSTYCCPRTNPFYSKNGVILGCYDEQIQRSMFFIINEYKETSRHVDMDQHKVIQPSIFSLNDDLFMINRNFGLEKNKCPLSKVLYSESLKKLVFKKEGFSNIPNHNESIATLNDKENCFIVYNKKKKRKDLTLGLLNMKNELLDSEDLLKLNNTSFASYPNMCLNNKGQLVISFTAYSDSNSRDKDFHIEIVTISNDLDRIIKRDEIRKNLLS